MNLVGQQIDHYRVEALVGEGGMGAVYKAMDNHLSRPVALKVMHAQFAKQPEFQRRFMQEAQAAARLDLPSIVKVYHFGVRPGLLYMVMEFVNGASLSAYLKRLRQQNQLIKLNETLAVLAQVADALGYAHRQGVIHRDVKPDNVLLKPLEIPDRDGDPPIRAVVTDFGLAKLIEGGLQTQTGGFMGTLPYMSPEQCLGKDLDGRSDIYALGVMLYQLTTGRLPFDIKTPAEAAAKHIHESPPAARSVRPSIPPAVEQIINRAIAKDPAGRYQTGEEMARALRQANTSLSDDDVTKFASTAGGTTPGGTPPGGPGAPSVVSILTQLMPAGAIDEPSRLGHDLTALPGVDRILITRKDQPPRAYNLEKNTVLIGRTSENDIVLNGEGVSRVHARLERKPGTTPPWRVVDMGSTNGTFVNSTRLLPDIPEPWEPKQALRIGPFLLHFQQAQGTVVMAGDGSYPATGKGRPIPAGATQVYSSSGQLTIVINPTNVELAPGGRADVQVQLLNQGLTVDHFTLQIEGVPPDWITIHNKSLQLMPGAEGSLMISIHPPQNTNAPAGSHPYHVLVSSLTNPNEAASVTGQVIIKPYEKFRVDMRPARLRTGELTRILVINEGNVETNFTILGRDPGEAIQYEGQRGRMQLAAGQKGTQDLVLTAQERPLLGRSRTLPFTVEVTAPSSAKQTIPGQLDVPARLPAWFLPLLGLFALCLCLSLGGLYTVYGNRNEQATQTAAALADAVLTAQATQTIVAQGTAAANQAAAITATSLAQTAIAQGDDDGDGLSNIQETTLGTSSTNPDTDGDGLSDGVEVNQHGTNPKQQDTDGDTLLDGAEVNQHRTSPTNPDTDGDGVPDGVEITVGSDPLRPPTATPTTAPTATPIPTNTPPTPPTNVPPTPPTPPTITPPPIPTTPPVSQSSYTAIFADFVASNASNRVQFQGPAASTVYLTVEPDNFDVQVDIYLLESDGTRSLLDHIDSSFDTEAAAFTLDEYAPYLLEISGYGGAAGNYSLTFSSTVDVLLYLNWGTDITGDLSAGGFIEFGFLTPVEGNFTVSVFTGVDLDAVVEVRNIITGSIEASADALVEGTEVVTLNYTAGGLYHIRVSGYGGDSGHFTMRFDP